MSKPLPAVLFLAAMVAVVVGVGPSLTSTDESRTGGESDRGEAVSDKTRETAA
jgi:hypothetical protein